MGSMMQKEWWEVGIVLRRAIRNGPVLTRLHNRTPSSGKNDTHPQTLRQGVRYAETKMFTTRQAPAEDGY